MSDEPTTQSPPLGADEGSEAAEAASSSADDLLFGLDRKILLTGISVVSALLLVGLILFALFLPPLNLASGLRGYTRLTVDNPTATHQDGISVTRAGEGDLRVHLGSTPRETFLATEGRGIYKGAAKAIPSFLMMKSPLYTIEHKGEGQAIVEIVIPNDAEPYATLDLYRWDEASGQWVFVPGHIDLQRGVLRTEGLPPNVAAFQTKPITPLVSTTLEAGQTWDEMAASAINMVLPTGIFLENDGTLGGAPVGGWRLGVGYAVVPVVRAPDAAALSSLLNNEASRALHVADLKAFVVNDGYVGVAIDYGAIDRSDRQAFAQFIHELAAALEPEGKILVVYIPRPAGGPDIWDTGGYDWRAIGEAADMVVLSLGDDPSQYAISGHAIALLSWATGEISRFKLHLASSALSADQASDGLELIGFDDALVPLGVVTLDTVLPEGADIYLKDTDITFRLNGDVSNFTADPGTGAYTYLVDRDDGQHRFWIVTASTIRSRLDMLGAYNVGGAMLNDALSGRTDDGLYKAITEFKIKSVSTLPNQLVMRWTVTGASGAVFSQDAGLGTPLIWSAREAGQFTVLGEIVGARVSDRGSVTVEIGEPKPTPTAPPTQRPVATSQAPAATDQPPATTPPPVTGSAAVGGFELGGQVPSAIGHRGKMQHAGMSWVKFQVGWPYVDVGTAGSFVSAGHDAGFKVLLSVKGPVYPKSIDYGAFISYLGQVAGMGPDAIEVWNEMNFDVEWPPSEISGSSYVNNMLAPAYQAIKAVNPNIMVISGAPTPSGAFGGCGTIDTPSGKITGCDDWFYVAQMRDAGATSYLDCVGVHYNEGIIPPSQSSGDPRSEHYTRYFHGMLGTYYSTFGVPVCFTELGYLSPEGFGSLPANFSWAQNTSVAEQAAWLAEAAVLSAQSGKVRLMIIWNVDFTKYDNDPQAGYAIVRPDGTCPACDALHNVMN